MNELEKIDKYIFEILNQLLFNIVPQYRQKVKQAPLEANLSDHGIYFCMYEFACHLTEEIKISLESEFVINSFKFINMVGESHNLELQNIIRVGVLEILYSTIELDRNEIKNMLNNKLRLEFSNFSKHYH